MAKIRQKRTKKPKGLPPPGCMVLPEDDPNQVTAKHRLNPQPPRQPAPRITKGERVSRTDVTERLMRALKTLRALPDREKRFFIVKSSSPDYVREYMDAYDPDNDYGPRFQPTPADVSDCLTALSWIRHLDKSAWQIVWWRSFDVSFGLIGKRIGRSDETARRRFEDVITDAWIAVNNPRKVA
ncbi:DUF6362 family protein [Agrobacterium sp. Ap1]|uniref:DUF6362 family protein n=1 Tax=Agrobacterium sp. Ap1 TaxID=2815337 RepID=UPI00256FD80F|nr:DUF6362 family protein [Agrobacterium sp. Ap1]